MMRHTSRSLAIATMVAAFSGCAPRAVPVPVVRPALLPAIVAPLATPAAAAPESAGMSASLGARIDSIIARALVDSIAPGAAVAIERHGRIVHLRGYGRTDWGESAPAVTDSTLFDLASLTKVIATTTLAMQLEDEGRLVLDSTVGHYLPEFVATDTLKRPITVRQLLTHTGGLEAYAALYTDTLVRGRGPYLARIADRPLKRAPGSGMEYSDWDMVLMQLVLERVTGQSLDAQFAARVATPLALRETVFRPGPGLVARTAATANDTTRGGILRGIVHDGNAYAIGGVSGHAGLFSSARDLARVSHLLLSNGRFGDTAVVRPATVVRWTSPQDPGSSRALGWDTPSGRSSAGDHFSVRSYGHTGFTGTSIWLDPERGLSVVLLTNRVHSLGTTAAGRVLTLRADVANAAQRAILDAPLVRR